MNVLVTGASGFLGQLVVRQLLSGGDSVRAMVRPGRAVAFPGAETTEGDLRRPEDIDAAVERSEAVVHCGARVQTHGPWDEFEATNVRAVERVIEAAQRGGSRRVIHVSSLSVYGIGGDGAVITEDSAYDEEAADRGSYSRSKLAADRLATAAAASGAPVTVIRPGVLYGPGRKPPLGRQSIALGPLRFILGRPGYLLPLAFGGNVADAISQGLHQERAATGAYTVVDPQVPMREYLSAYRAASGAKWHPVFVPAAVLLPMVRLAGAGYALAGRKPPVSAHQIQRSTWSATFDCTRARTELGWVPRVSLAEGLRLAVGAP